MGQNPFSNPRSLLTEPMPLPVELIAQGFKFRPEIHTLKRGTELFRIFNENHLGPAEFSAWGPQGRFDHQRGGPLLPGETDAEPLLLDDDELRRGPVAHDPERRIYYAALRPIDCIAEVFTQSRIITREGRALAITHLCRPLHLLDLTGLGAHLVGCTPSVIHCDYRVSQLWSRFFYRAPQINLAGLIDGLFYPSRRTGDPCLALYERAETALELRPLGKIPLSDPILDHELHKIADRLGFDF